MIGKTVIGRAVAVAAVRDVPLKELTSEKNLILTHFVRWSVSRFCRYIK
jgi:hypothetical protein